MLRFDYIEHSGQLYLIELPHVQYYSFATRNFIKHQELSPTIEKLRNKTIKIQNENDIWFQHHETMINTLLYSALSLEAFINYYAIRYEIENTKDYERSLSTTTKWKLYPKLKTGKTIDTDAIGIIKKIFKLRNGFAHPVPQKVKARQKKPTYKDNSHGATLERLDKGQLISDVNSVYQAIFNIDEDEQLRHKQIPWLMKMTKRTS